MAALLGMASIAGAVSLSACASGSPSAETPCGHKLESTGSRGDELVSAALSRATVVVIGERAPKSRCLTFHGFADTVTLRIADYVEFEANDIPTLEPAGSEVVAISTRQGPSRSFLGQAPTPHLIVRLTAKHPGTVAVHWTDCSGTSC